MLAPLQRMCRRTLHLSAPVCRVIKSKDPAVLVRVFLLLCVVFGVGCRHAGWLSGHAQQDLLGSFDTEKGYVLLEGAHMRAVIQPAAYAAVVVSTQEGARPIIAERVGSRLCAQDGVFADRLLTQLSGSLQLDAGPWELREWESDRLLFHGNVQISGSRDGAFALAVAREIRLHDRAALQGFIPDELGDRVQVSGYESRTFFTNPGPLPWPRIDGLPAIQIEGSFRRSLDTLLVLHIQPYSETVVSRQIGGGVAAGAAMLRLLHDADESRMEIPYNFVLPRLALLDRQQDLLTLLAYTPPVGPLGLRAGDVERTSPEIVISASEGDVRWVRVVSSGVALPLATGGSMRHHRQTFHVRGPQEELLRIAAAFCRLPQEDVLAALHVLEVREGPADAVE